MTQKKFLSLIFCCTLIALGTRDCLSDWVLMSNGIGIPGGIYSLSVNNGVIYCGTQNQVLYRSTNEGQSWGFIPFTGGPERSILFNGNNMFIGTDAFGVYVSSNNGTNWQQTPLNNQKVYAMASSGNNIFAGTDGSGVYLSTNNGVSWVQTSLNNRIVRTILINGNNIFAGTDGNGVYLSTNNGTSWVQTSLNTTSVRALLYKGNTVFAGTYTDELFYSTNNGLTWFPRTVSNHGVWSLAAAPPQFVNFMFAGTGDGICVSSDNGTSWIPRNEGFPNANVGVMCIAGNYIFAGTGGWGLFRRPLDELLGIKIISSEIPNQFSLLQNYPNPFNPSTHIEFSIPKRSFVKLFVYDILGRELKILVNETVQPGVFGAVFDAQNLPSGIYYYSLEAGDYKETKKMVLVK